MINYLSFSFVCASPDGVILRRTLSPRPRRLHLVTPLCNSGMAKARAGKARADYMQLCGTLTPDGFLPPMGFMGAMRRVHMSGR